MDDLLITRVAPDASQATLFISARLDLQQASTPRLVECVQGAGVLITPEIRARLSEISASFIERPRDIDTEVARLTPACDGRDATIVWGEGLDPTRVPEPVQGENGTIDHYRQPHFIQVNAGDVLAEVTAETPGAPGCDVRGRAIKARQGRKLTLRFDDASTMVENGRLIARTSGVLQLVHGEVTVTDLLRIEGDVDFSTASVDTHGSVIVKGGVRDRFTIRAGKNIQIGGLVEAAILEAHGDIVLSRGMAARESGLIRADGALTAGFLNGVRVEIEGSLTLGREMIGCIVRCGGEVDAGTATIIGGELSVAGAVRVGVLGSRGEAPTIVRLGHAPRLVAQRDRFLDAIALIDRVLGKWRQGPAPSDTHRDDPPAAGAPAPITARSRMDDYLRRRQGCEGRVARLERAIGKRCRVDLRVNKVIHPNTRIEAGDTTFVVRRMIRGPARIAPGPDGQLMISIGDGPARPLAEFGEVRRAAA